MLQETEPEAPAEDSPPADQQDGAPPAGDDLGDAAAEDSTNDSADDTSDESGDDAAVAPGDDIIEIEPGESAIETLVGADAVRDKLESFLAWAQSQMITIDLAIQAGLLFAALAPAAVFGPQLKKLIQSQIAPRAPYGVLRRAANAFAHIATPIALYIILQICVVTLQSFDVSSGLVGAGKSLLAAWIVIRLVTLVIRSPFWSRVAFYVAWPIAALDAFGVLGEVIVQLDSFSVPIGENENGEAERLSALDIIRTLTIFGLLFWVASFVNKFVTSRINAIDELTVSFKALLTKILNVLFPIVALIAALQIVGFPFGTLAIFGGAVGLGIGLGMQRTVSNFFAGFTLIADKSIKPGDVIQIQDTFGWVTQMNSRYVSIRTRDGMAHLMPNDRFINEGVINWSHSDRVVRLHAPFGVSYGTKDLRALARAAEATALEVERVLKTPAPRCNLMAFGDSSINFDLRFWINDPAKGIANVRSDVLMAIWDMLADKGIEVPFPQRDLHIKSAPPDWPPDRPLETADKDAPSPQSNFREK
ncbi:MAG: mechanosensitive ion channel domain-containing protein [Hyphococcus sp.]